MFASAPAGSDTSNDTAAGTDCGRVTAAPDSVRMILPSAPVAVDGNPSPARSAAILSAAASNRPMDDNALACAHRTLAHVLASRNACAARCSATASAGSASRGRPDATRTSPTSADKSHAILASKRYGSEPHASTPSHSSGGDSPCPPTMSLALGECDSVDANGAAMSAAEILAASTLCPAPSSPAPRPPCAASLAAATAPLRHPHRPYVRRHASGSPGVADPPAVVTVQ